MCVCVFDYIARAHNYTRACVYKYRVRVVFENIYARVFFFLYTLRLIDDGP